MYNQIKFLFPAFNMSTNIVIIIAVAALVFIGGLFLIANPKSNLETESGESNSEESNSNEEQGNSDESNSMDEVNNSEGNTPKPADSPENATYIIENEAVTLINGKSEESIPNASTKIETSIWDSTEADLTENEQQDTGLVLIQIPGGSGTFYYAAASINTPEGYVGTNAILLGDRVAMKSIEISEGIFIVNYADRPDGASMAEEPSEAITKRFKVEGTTLSEITE